MEDIKTKIEAFLSRFYRRQLPDGDADIFSLGFVNSLFAMQLIMFLEKEFNINVDNRDMDLENFRTINSITCFIEEKRRSTERVGDF